MGRHFPRYVINRQITTMQVSVDKSDANLKWKAWVDMQTNITTYPLVIFTPHPPFTLIVLGIGAA